MAIRILPWIFLVKHLVADKLRVVSYILARKLKNRNRQTVSLIFLLKMKSYKLKSGNIPSQKRNLIYEHTVLKYSETTCSRLWIFNEKVLIFSEPNT